MTHPPTPRLRWTRRQLNPAVSGKPCGFPHPRSVQPDAARLRAASDSGLWFCLFRRNRQRAPRMSHLSYMSHPSHETPSTEPPYDPSVYCESWARRISPGVACRYFLTMRQRCALSLNPHSLAMVFRGSGLYLSMFRAFSNWYWRRYC